MCERSFNIKICTLLNCYKFVFRHILVIADIVYICNLNTLTNLFLVYWDNFYPIREQDEKIYVLPILSTLKIHGTSIASLYRPCRYN